MTFLETVNQYWGIIIFLAGLSFHAIWVYFKVGDHEKRIAVVEKRTDIHSDMIAKLEARLDSIEAKLDILVEGYNQSTKRK